MEEDILLSPLILKPVRIYSYSQLIASLKRKQKKLEKYKSSVQMTNFTDVLKPKSQIFDVHDVVDGFLHTKLKTKLKEHEVKIDKSFIKELENSVKQLRNENDMFVVGSSKIIGKVTELEMVFNKETDDIEEYIDMEVRPPYFNDPMLYDIYVYLRQMTPEKSYAQEIKFLNIEYLKYIERFLKENADKIKAPLNRIEDKISTFVRLRYGREEFNLEVYEGRYVFAEVYTMLRCGLYQPIIDILEKYHPFFEHICHRFKSNFMNWLNSKTKPSIPPKINAEDDVFKVFLLGLIDNTAQKNSPVVGSIEDYIWILLNNVPKHPLELFKGYTATKGLLLAYIMLKEYNKAMELIFKSDFQIIPSYFIMKALCSKCSKKKVFVDFVFLIASKFSNTKNKVEILESLKLLIDNYYQTVPEMIIKNEMFEVLGIDDGTNLYLDKKINERIIEILKNKNEKKKLIKLYYLIDDEPLVVDIISDVLVEAILTDTNIDEYAPIIDYYQQRTNIKEIQKMTVLKNFYLFMRNPDVTSLRKTPMFDLNVDLLEYKYVIEKLMRPACEIIEKMGDKEMAKAIFRLCGLLGLNDSVSSYVSRRLVLLI